MKKIIFSMLLLTSPAYAHLVPLKDEGLITIAGGDYDTAFKLEDACVKADVKGDDCRKLLGFSDTLRGKAARECVAAGYVPVSDVMKKRINKQKSRGHTELLEDAQLGKHFYTVDSITSDEAARAFEAKFSGRGPHAKDRPLLGGQTLNAICSERANLCVTEGSQTLQSPIYKSSSKDVNVGPVVGAVGVSMGRQLPPVVSEDRYKAELEACIEGKLSK